MTIDDVRARYSPAEMLAWAKYYQLVARQYHDRGRVEEARRDYASARRFLFATIDGRCFAKVVL